MEFCTTARTDRTEETRLAARRRKLRLRLAALAFEALTLCGSRGVDAEQTASVNDGATLVTLTVRPVAMEQEPEIRPPVGVALAPFFLSPTERQIVAYLAVSGPAKAKTVARRTGDLDERGDSTTKMRYALSTLVERGLLEVTQEGYCLTPAFSPQVVSVLGKKAVTAAPSIPQPALKEPADIVEDAILDALHGMEKPMPHAVLAMAANARAGKVSPADLQAGLNRLQASGVVRCVGNGKEYVLDAGRAERP